MPEKIIKWTDPDGYPQLVCVFDDGEPAEGLKLSVELEAYDLPPKVQQVMFDRGFLTPDDYRAKAGVFRAMIGALRAAGQPCDKWTANAIVRQIREDYHGS